jgi:hypothetical protein
VDPVETQPADGPGSPAGAGMPRWAGYGPPRLLDRALGPMRVTRRGMDYYACDATLQPVLVDDHGGLLGVAAPVATIHPDLRAALEVRDLGCRFPGCAQPPARTHAHHLVYRRRHGPTVAENLVLLCAHHHRVVHDRGWRLTLHDDATLTARRGKRILTSVPAHHQWLPAPDPPTRRRRRRDPDAPVSVGNRGSPGTPEPPDLPF